jgi:excisionase family DNA binding protein
MINDTPSADPAALLTPHELSDYVKVPVQTLYMWRYHGKGPEAIKVGRHLRYRREAVESWLAANS